jgi:transposase
MDIDLAHLPNNVEDLQRMVRSLASNRTALSDAHAEIELILAEAAKGHF